MRLKTRLVTLAVIAIGAPAAASVAPLVALPAIVAVAPASAASCTSSLGNTYFPNGDYAFPHYLTNCTDVNGVEFKNVVCCSAYTTGWQNWSNNIKYRPPSPQNPDVYGLYYAASSYGFTWYRHRICSTSNTINVVHVTSSFRIHNASQGTWGNWYTSEGPRHDIWCYA